MSDGRFEKYCVYTVRLIAFKANTAAALLSLKNKLKNDVMGISVEKHLDNQRNVLEMTWFLIFKQNELLH